jgi:xanthine dehydrogenase small subunit
MNAENVRFLLNGRLVVVDSIDPTRSVLSFLREDQRCTGSKEGCAEGDCGACTVVVGELKGEALQTRTVNACIQFVPTLDGKALFTVEYLRQVANGLHPAQQAMVDCHGSQCGFCTPGFIMSLWNTYNHHDTAGTRPNRQELANCLSGNLCRCTGYKPILEAGEKMFDLPRCCFDRETITAKLLELRRSKSLQLEHEGITFHAPRSLPELTRLRADKPHATLLAGCTDIGLWVNKLFRNLGDIVYLGEVSELKQLELEDGRLRIGAGVTLSDAYAELARYYPQVREMWERFASLPIRNAGTLGGNVANGSPVGDSMPWLIALGARVVLTSLQGTRTIPMEALYVDYMRKSMRPDELVEALEVPLPTADLCFRTYKLSKRYDSDISAVCGAFAMCLDGEIISQARVSFGGMAAMPQRAVACENALNGKLWNEATVRAAMHALKGDYSPLSDMRASAAYRSRTAGNLLYRFFLETRPANPLSVTQTSVFANVQEAL